MRQFFQVIALILSLFVLNNAYGKTAKIDIPTKYFEFEGKKYVMAHNNSSVTEIHPGDKVVSQDGSISGVVTGSIVVKLSDPNNPLTFKTGSIMDLTQGFYIITFSKETNLFTQLSTLVNMSNVDSAEIQVKVK